MAHKAFPYFCQLSLSFTAALTFFHDLHPAHVLSASTILCHVVFGLPSSCFLQVSTLVLHRSHCLVLFSAYVQWTFTIFMWCHLTSPCLSAAKLPALSFSDHLIFRICLRHVFALEDIDLPFVFCHLPHVHICIAVPVSPASCIARFSFLCGYHSSPYSWVT